uniref:Uncharacterized protein n=1 Tax=Timema shepardi TaxID=629360 RepID=A0A7R9B349_TIMSH|nr:unnamed protein product [Timema shepardi]
MAGFYSNTSSSMLVTRPIRGSRRGRPRGSRRGGLTRASTTANTITVNLTNSDLGLAESRHQKTDVSNQLASSRVELCQPRPLLAFFPSTNRIKEKHIPASLSISSSNYCSAALSGTLGYLDKWRLFESCVGLSYTARLID